MQGLRLRFSVLTLVLTTVLVALAIAVCQLASQVGPLRTENRRLKEERGELAFTDRTRVHVIRVSEQFARNSSTFRVFIPDGTNYVAYAVVNGIPKSGLPEIIRNRRSGGSGGQDGRRAFLNLLPGEHLVSLSVARRHDGTPFVRFGITQHGFWNSMAVISPKDGWPEKTPSSYSTDYGDNQIGVTTQSVASDQPLVLLRQRISNDDSDPPVNVSDPPGLLDGMMLWIEPLDPLPDDPTAFYLFDSEGISHSMSADPYVPATYKSQKGLDELIRSRQQQETPARTSEPATGKIL